MARPKRQQQRRDELIAATQRVLAAVGPEGTKLRRVAEEAGLTSGAVLYYYPELADLVGEAVRASMERFSENRRRMLDEIPDSPIRRLVALVENGLPRSSDDMDVRILSELGGTAGRSPVFAMMLTTLYDRQVDIYQLVLEQGASRGVFTLASDARSIARNIVALEDAYGYRIIARHPSIDRAHATRLILEVAARMTDCPALLEKTALDPDDHGYTEVII